MNPRGPVLACVRGCARLGALLVVMGAVAACAGVRAGEHTSAPSEPPPAAANPSVASRPETVVADSVADPKVPEVATPAAGCSCVEAKVRPKPKPRPKPVPKEAAPQLPTAPVVIETAKGGLVDAQVRPMSVSVMSILGKRVQGPHGEDFGRVVDVLADSSGRVRIAIIDFAGFLGVGNRRVAVDWPLLRFNPDLKDPSLLLSLSREKLQSAPEYKDNPRPQTLMEPLAAPAPTAPDTKQ